MKATTLFLFFSIIFLSCSSDKDFPLVSVNHVTTIDLRDSSSFTSLHCDKDGVWTVGENRWTVNNLKVSNLLEILSRISIDYPLPLEDESNYTPDLIRTAGMEVKVFEKSKLVKKYYMMFPDKYNCLAVLEGQKQVYNLILPGEDIHLADYISTAPQFWQNNIAIDYRIEEISQVDVQNNLLPNESFSLVRDSLGSVRLFSMSTGDIQNVDSIAANRYLSYFRSVCFDDYLMLPKVDLERIKVSTPMYVLSITSADGVRRFKAIPKTEIGKIDYDRDFFYLFLDNNKLALAKWINFDILFKNISDLRKIND